MCTPSADQISQFIALFRHHHPEHIMVNQRDNGLEVTITDFPPNQSAMSSLVATWDPIQAAYVVTVSSPMQDDCYDEVYRYLGVAPAQPIPVATYTLKGGSWVYAMNL